MRKSTPDAAITSSATGTTSRSGSGAGSDASPARSPSHCATLNTVKRLRNGTDRKSVVEGKSVSVRVDLGGRRIIQKKQYETQTKTLSLTTLKQVTSCTMIARAQTTATHD